MGVKPKMHAVRYESQKDYSGGPSVGKGVKVRLEARRPVQRGKAKGPR